MSAATPFPDSLSLTGAPAIPGLCFRRFRGAADYPKMLEVSIGSKAADGLDEADTLEGLTIRYTHLNHCDPQRDILMVEAAGQLVGFGRTYWQTEVSGDVWQHNLLGWLLPAWRRRGVGRAMLRWLEQQASAVSTELAPPREAARYFQIFSAEPQVGKTALLEREG
jgi:GNAT superfamily N-acetyltransferase